MSADYDRLFHSSEPGKPVDDATAIVDRDAILKAAAAAAPPPVPVGETSATDVPVAPTAATQTQAAAQPRHAETGQQMPAPMPQPPATAPQWPQNS
ncbi:MinD/ParA family protein, partial [Mycolicibacterium fortuitum]